MTAASAHRTLAGFTLMETLCALSLLAFCAVMGAYVLSESIGPAFDRMDRDVAEAEARAERIRARLTTP